MTRYLLIILLCAASNSFSQSSEFLDTIKNSTVSGISKQNQHISYLFTPNGHRVMLNSGMHTFFDFIGMYNSAGVYKQKDRALGDLFVSFKWKGSEIWVASNHPLTGDLDPQTYKTAEKVSVQQGIQFKLIPSE